MHCGLPILRPESVPSSLDNLHSFFPDSEEVRSFLLRSRIPALERVKEQYRRRTEMGKVPLLVV